MKKILLFLAPILLAIVVFLVVMFFLDQNSKKGALQITSIPKSKVYLNGKLIGETPLCKCDGSEMLQPGQYTIRLLADEGDFIPYEEKVTIAPSVLTVLDRTFGKGGFAQGKTITLTKLNDNNAIELLVISFPQDAEIFVDNNLLGTTPFSHKTLTKSDHELKLVKAGYQEKIIRIRTVSGYKLTVVASLGVLPDLGVIQASGSASEVASSSALPSVVKVTILQTPTTDNHLNVRESPSLSGKIIGKVFTDETFDFIEEKDGWFSIKLKDGKTGWVSNQYAKKQ